MANTPFQRVFDKVRSTYSPNGNYMFDVFVKQADGQIFWEKHCWSYQQVINHYFAYVSDYPNRSIAIILHDELIASAYWTEDDVYFKHFPPALCLGWNNMLLNEHFYRERERVPLFHAAGNKAFPV